VNFADELRAAAMLERDEWPTPKDVGALIQACLCHHCRDVAIHLALADWLDHTASLIEGNSGAIEGVQSSGMALLTARAINGGGV